MVSRSFAFGLSLPSRIHDSSSKTLPCRQRRHHRTICTATAKKNVVFLGTPQVAANALEKLKIASNDPASSFSLTCVVSQPPAPTGRKRVLTKSPVHALADDLDIPTLTPITAKDPEFLSALSSLSPDLCITAAYGNFLPSKFLALPRYGTLNIHPSLLPHFRGAAPVPRALEAGVDVTGVSILYTVLKMDAGPIVATRERVLDGNELAPDLLAELFDTGVDALLDVLPSVWDDTVEKIEQDESQASHAPKISKDEARLTFNENAKIVHNKVRAFAGWPGTWGDFELPSGETMRLKIGSTRVLRPEGGMCFGVHEVKYDADYDCLSITCDDGSKLGILEVQAPGKKAVNAKSFWNGLRGKYLERKRLPH